MPLLTGNIQVFFTAQHVGSHSVYYTISCCDQCTNLGTSPIVVPTPVAGVSYSANIPLEYVDPSCDIICINGRIVPDCETDPAGGTYFSRQFNLDKGCRNYTLKCINPQGCTGFDTTPVCPECTEWTNIGISNNDQWTTYSNYQFSPTVSLIAENDYIPKDTEFNLCYSNPQNITQELGTTDWSITLNTDTPTVEKPCCWECEARVWTVHPATIADPLNFPKVYPTLYYTACDAKYETLPDVKCFAAEHWLYSDPTKPNTYTACIRKGSWTMLGANLNNGSTPLQAGEYTTALSTNPCDLPPPYNE